MHCIPLCWHRMGFTLVQLRNWLSKSSARTCGLTLGVGMALYGLALAVAPRLGDTGTDCA